jgi:hypothetical protein
MVDVASIGRQSEDELLARAREHSRPCAMVAHCVASGYGLVNDQGHSLLLESAATPAVVRGLQANAREHRVRLRVRREEGENGKVPSVGIKEIGGERFGASPFAPSAPRDVRR